MKKMLKSLLPLIGGCILSIALLSCENFLKASETKNEIENAIAYNNAKTYVIKVTADKGSGSIIKPVGGEIIKKASDSFTVSFEPAKDYTFVRWEAYSDKLPQGQSIKDYVEIEDPASLETKVTFLKEIDSLVIYANCPRIPYTTVYIDGKNGNISPSRNYYTVNMDEENFISFEPSNEYAFIKWQVYDEKTDTPIENGLYLQIDNPELLSTHYKLVKIPTDQDIQLSVKPIVIDRPKIITKSPVYNPEQGAYRDSRILVMFNKTMDLDSIYYVENESTKEITEIKQKNNLTDADLLWVNIGKGGAQDLRCYGYKKHDGDIVFKNISIVNGKNAQENMLRYFENPRFEDPGRLTISPMKNKETNEYILPNPGTSFIVTIGKEFTYTYQGHAIELKESETWPYYVSYKTDDQAPFISKLEIRDEDNNEIFNTENNTSNDYTYIRNSRKIKIRVNVEDVGSGPLSSFDLILQGQTAAGQTVNKTISLDYEFTDGQNAYCGNAYETNDTVPKTYSELTLDDIPEGDGTYSFKLKFYDNGGKSIESTNTYYICIDTTPIASENITNRTISTQVNNSKPEINYTYYCVDDEFKEGKLFYRKASSVVSGNQNVWSDDQCLTLTKSNTDEITSKIITDLDFGTTYELKAEFYDKADNKTTFLYKKNTIYKDNTITQANVDEISRTIKVDIDSIPNETNNIKLLYKNNVSNSYSELSYDPLVEKAFIIRNIDYCSTYSFYLLNQSDEEIPSEYDNATTEVIHTSSPTANPQTLETKPAPADYDFSGAEDGIYIFLADFGINEKNYTHIKYELYNYSTNLTTTSNKIEFTDLLYDESISWNCYLKLEELNPGTHYLIKLYTYNNDTQCDDKDIQYIDVYTNIANFKIPKNQGDDKKTQTTATLNWTTPNTEFDYYIVTWKLKDSSSILGKTIVSKDKTSILLTNLPEYQDITASITYVTKTGESIPSTLNFTAMLPVSMINVENQKISNIHFQDAKPNTYAEGICFDYSGSINDLYYKWGNSYNAITYRNTSITSYRDQYTILNNGGRIEFSYGTNANEKFYIQVFNNSDEPVSDVIALKNYPGNRPFIQSYSYTVTGNSITLHWNPGLIYSNTASNTIFIHIQPTGSTWPGSALSSAQELRVSDRDYRFTGLDPDTAYDIRIFPSKATASTHYFLCCAKTNNMVVTSITSPQIHGVEEDKLTIEWNEASCLYYNVYKKDGNNNILIADRIPQETPYVDIYGLTPDTNYQFVISSCSDSEEVKYAQTLTTRTLKKAISEVKFETITESTASISWDKADEYSYKFKYKKHGDSSWIEYSNNIPNSGNNPLLVEGLEALTEYDVRIQALNNSQIIKTVDAYFKTAAVPAEFGEAEKTSSSITLNWTNPSGTNYSKIILSYTTAGLNQPVNILMIKSDDSNKPVTTTLNNLLPGKEYTFKLITYADESMTNRNVKTLTVTTN